MNGVVFQTSAAIAMKIVGHVSVSGSVSQLNSAGTKPPSALENASRHAKAATTVTMPYGISDAVRTRPRPTSARCMTSASSMPSTSSMATDTTVMKTVRPRSDHHRLELSTVT